MELVRFNNPNNTQQVVNFIYLIVGFSLTVIITGYVIGYGYGDDFSVLVGWTLALSYGGLLLAILLMKEFVRRPRSVGIFGSGIMLTSRLGRERFIPWDGIRYLAIDVEPEKPWHGKIYHDSKIMLINGPRVLVIQDIGMAVKKAYEESTGKEMPQYIWGSEP